MAKKKKTIFQSKGKLGAAVVMATGGFVIVYSLIKGDLNASSALAAVTTMGMGLSAYGIRDKQDS